jgi:hypothetical protein
MRTLWKPPTDLYEPTISNLGPTDHVNPFMDIEIIAHSYPTASRSIKGPLPFRQGAELEQTQEHCPFHLVNFSSSLLTPTVTLLVFNIKNAGCRAITL